MNTADFLFPRDLQSSPTTFRRMLFIGSCLSEVYVRRLAVSAYAVNCDFILFNNASDLPAKSSNELALYDLQYIQLPLRSILTDAVIRIADHGMATPELDFFKIGQNNIDKMLEKAMSYNPNGNILTLVSNFIVPQGRISPSLYDNDSPQDIVWVVRKLNDYLAQSIKKYAQTYLADVDMVANSLGKRYFLDDIIFFYTHGSNFYRDWSGHERYPQWTAPEPGRIEDMPDIGETYENRFEEFYDTIFRQIEAIYRTVNQIDMVKAVIFDLDNTLWRGQLAEHYQPGTSWPYVEGWPLGIWEAISHLRRRGIVVSLASKNDFDIVQARWHDVVDPPFVKLSDFVSPQINWKPKAENIAKILQELSLTPASAVFVDDNPVERESVKAQLPGIRTIGSDPFTIRRILLWAPETQIAFKTKESARREEMLKHQIQRETERTAMSREEFLQNLEAKVNIWELKDTSHSSFSRVSELVNKTNQFNTNGERWTVDQYLVHFRNNGRVFAFSVKDRYTEYGTVGVIFTLDNCVVQFIMSCRVLGMEIETGVLKKIVDIVRINYIDAEIHGSIVNTEANTPVRNIYLNSGFLLQDGHKYVLEKGHPANPASHVEVNFVA